MSDLIDRQVAIDELQKEINKGIPPFDDVMGAIRCGVRLARNIIEDLPSAQPQRKRGKWIDNDKINFPQCSECGMWIDVMQQSGEMNFCPNCGADMRGDENEDT